MAEVCENLAGCPFFKAYCGNNEVIKKGWIKMYCEDKSKSETCKRKLHKKTTGNPPPVNMSPAGSMLPQLPGK